MEHSPWCTNSVFSYSVLCRLFVTTKMCFCLIWLFLLFLVGGGLGVFPLLHEFSGVGGGCGAYILIVKFYTTFWNL